MAEVDSCPSCGERMQPVLQRDDHPLEPGPLLADPPVLLVCPACAAPDPAEDRAR